MVNVKPHNKVIKDKMIDFLKENTIFGYTLVGLLGFTLGFFVFYLAISFVVLDSEYLFKKTEWSTCLRLFSLWFSTFTAFASVMKYWEFISKH